MDGSPELWASIANVFRAIFDCFYARKGKIAGYEGISSVLDRDECSSTPCQNSGICVDKFADYQCTCLNGFTGKNCETGEWYFKCCPRILHYYILLLSIYL